MSEYQSYYQWKKWDLSFSFSTIEKRYYEKEFGNTIVAGSRIIEIGFGNGGLLAWAKERSAEAFGVEIQADLLAAAREHGYVAVDHLEHLLPYRKDGFDAVIALDVFEHMPHKDIRALLSLVEVLLKPGGTLTIRVPNGLSPFGRYNQHGDATHVDTVTPAKLAQLSFATQMRLDGIRNEARIFLHNNLSHRVGKILQFALRDCVNKMVATIYGFPVSALDPNIIVVLKKIKAMSADAGADDDY